MHQKNIYFWKYFKENSWELQSSLGQKTPKPPALYYSTDPPTRYKYNDAT